MSQNNYEKADYWSKKAFAEGYPARSVYKLSEIDEKFGFFPASAKAGFSVLDLGSAPGSWTALCLKKLQGLGKVVSCDLKDLSQSVAGAGLVFFKGDLNTKSVREQIKAQGPYDLVLCDAAPATSGNRTVDSARSEALVEMALWYASAALKKGGKFAAKIFQSGAEQRLLLQMRKTFQNARAFKPKACRKESFETYLIGLGFVGAGGGSD